MFAYCNNNPVNGADYNGEFFTILHTIIEELKELYYIFGTGDGTIAPVRQGDSNLTIQNSSRIKNPLFVFGYSVYLKYFSEQKDSFEGSALGIAFEWEFHNIAYDVATLGDSFGFNTESLKEQAQHADIGPTIYADSHGLASKMMCSVYRLLFPVHAMTDELIAIFNKLEE